MNFFTHSTNYLWLKSRLVSRFQWGLVTDIQPPDLETRIAIRAKKAKELEVTLESNVLNYLAEHVSSNVRRLEGALTRVASYMELTKAKVDISILKIFMKDLLLEIEGENGSLAFG
jgi:chromosomal replication initiator protein